MTEKPAPAPQSNTDTEPVNRPDNPNIPSEDALLDNPDTNIDHGQETDQATRDDAKDTLRNPNIARRIADALKSRMADQQDASPDDLQRAGQTARTRKKTKRIDNTVKILQKQLGKAEAHAASALHPSVRARRQKNVDAIKRNLTDQQAKKDNLANKHLEKAGTKAAKAELKDLGYNRRERKLAMKDIVHVRRELGRLTLNLNVYNKDEKSTKKRAEIIERNLNKVTSKTDEIHRQSEMTETSVEAAKTELAELAEIHAKLMEEYAALKEELKDHPNPVDDERVVSIFETIGQNARDMAERRDEVKRLSQESKILSRQEEELTRQQTALEDKSSEVRSRLGNIRDRQSEIDAKIADEKQKIRQGNV